LKNRAAAYVRTAARFSIHERLTAGYKSVCAWKVLLSANWCKVFRCSVCPRAKFTLHCMLLVRPIQDHLQNSTPKAVSREVIKYRHNLARLVHNLSQFKIQL